jgi:putative transposase
MAAGPSIDVPGWLEEQLAQASPDLLRSMVQTFAEALMGADVGDARKRGHSDG